MLATKFALSEFSEYGAAMGFHPHSFAQVQFALGWAALVHLVLSF